MHAGKTLFKNRNTSEKSQKYRRSKGNSDNSLIATSLKLSQYFLAPGSSLPHLLDETIDSIS